MIPATISAVFFLIALVLGSMALMAAEIMRYMQPYNKWRYVVYTIATALLILAGVFFNQL